MNRLLIIALLITGLFSCTGSRPVGQSSPDKVEKLTAKIRLFHVNSDTTRIYFSLSARKQDYYMLSDRSKFKASYRLTYEIIQSENGKKTRMDSSSLRLVDLQPIAAEQKITAFVETKLPDNKNYSIKLSIVNINNGARFDHYLKFSKDNCVSPENILVMSNNGTPLLEKNYIYTEGNIYLRQGCEQGIALKIVRGGIGLPTPPFGTDDFAAKNNYSTEEVNVEKEKGSFSFTNLEKGVYLVSTGENSGVIFYHFNKWFPNCSDTSGFYEPLIFISSRDEYESFKDAAQSKTPFETFWLNHSGNNKTAARKAINEYYKRVFEANAEFTSIQEGWRTDRGMIYVVFGKPGYVEKQMNREIWIYRTAFNTSLSFTFYKIDNTYSDNDYRLERDLKYKPQWYNAVENWRNGKPFSLNGY